MLLHRICGSCQRPGNRKGEFTNYTVEEIDTIPIVSLFCDRCNKEFPHYAVLAKYTPIGSIRDTILFPHMKQKE